MEALEKANHKHWFGTRSVKIQAFLPKSADNPNTVETANEMQNEIKIVVPEGTLTTT